MLLCVSKSISKFTTRKEETTVRKILGVIQFILIDCFLGGCDGYLLALVVFTAAASITSVMCTIIDKKLTWNMTTKGIFQIIVVFILVGTANILDTYIIDTESSLRTAIIFFYTSNESIILLKNAAHIGLNIPQKLRDVLEQFY